MSTRENCVPWTPCCSRTYKRTNRNPDYGFAVTLEQGADTEAQRSTGATRGSIRFTAVSIPTASTSANALFVMVDLCPLVALYCIGVHHDERSATTSRCPNERC